ncbi:hypothetical protein [Clostridium sp. UBA1652]|uniref:hypothetical protein n=1 Tax=Clostridium sp. UBA1652 TaxID=1946348 RepID=UPI00257CEDFB|nr:hypothetical protein [Clostridium sp. UBA1652]
MNKEQILKRLVESLGEKSDQEVLGELGNLNIEYYYNPQTEGQIFLYNDLYEDILNFSQSEIEIPSIEIEYENTLVINRLSSTPSLDLKSDMIFWGGLAS